MSPEREVIDGFPEWLNLTMLPTDRTTVIFSRKQLLRLFGVYLPNLWDNVRDVEHINVG